MTAADSPRSARSITITRRDASLAMVAAGLLGIAVSNLIAGDFAFQWQPVPKNLPDRALIARIAAVILAVIAVALISRYQAKALRWLAAYLAIWTIGLHGPVAVARPASIGAWLGVAEIGAVLIAVCALSAASKHNKLWTRAFGLCPIIFAASHFAYPEITANMVPGWIPAPMFWAYFTGAAHLAGGVAILAGLLHGLPAFALGGMYLSWAVLLHLPRVLAAPGNRVEWTMLFIAIIISASTFAISAVIDAKREETAAY